MKTSTNQALTFWEKYFVVMVVIFFVVFVSVILAVAAFL
jgi:hypothetical protein